MYNIKIPTDLRLHQGAAKLQRLSGLRIPPGTPSKSKPAIRIEVFMDPAAGVHSTSPKPLGNTSKSFQPKHLLQAFLCLPHWKRIIYFQCKITLYTTHRPTAAHKQWSKCAQRYHDIWSRRSATLLAPTRYITSPAMSKGFSLRRAPTWWPAMIDVENSGVFSIQRRRCIAMVEEAG